MFLPSQSIRSVIGQEKLHHFVHQSVQNQTKMRRSNSRFPALQPVFLFLLWILIGSLWWFPLFWLAFLWSLVEVTTLDRKTLDWTPWLIMQGVLYCKEKIFVEKTFEIFVLSVVIWFLISDKPGFVEAVEKAVQALVRNVGSGLMKVRR